MFFLSSVRHSQKSPVPYTVPYTPWCFSSHMVKMCKIPIVYQFHFSHCSKTLKSLLQNVLYFSRDSFKSLLQDADVPSLKRGDQPCKQECCSSLPVISTCQHFIKLSRASKHKTNGLDSAKQAAAKIIIFHPLCLVD